MKESRKKNTVIILIILVLAFFFILFFHLPKALYFGHSVYNHEPIWRGTIAKDLIDGLRTDNFFDYQYTNYEGGTLLVGILAVPCFLLLGDSFFSLSLIPIGFALLTLIVMYLFLLRYFGKDVAIIASFLFIFSPAMYIFRQVCAYGNFMESLLFTMLIFFICFELFFNREQKHTGLLLALFGLVSGLGIYFCYVVFIACALWFLFLIIGRRRLFRGGNFFIFLFFFLVGFSPWLGYNMTRHFSGVMLPSYNASVPHITLFDFFSKRAFAQFISSFMYVIPHIKDVLLIHEHTMHFYLVIGMVFGSIIFLIVRNVGIGVQTMSLHTKGVETHSNKRLQESFLVLYVIVYVIIWALYPLGASRMHLSHYLYPIYPFVFIIIAVCIHRIKTSTVRWFYYLRYPVSLVCVFGVVYIGFMNYHSYDFGAYYKLMESIFRIKGYSLEYTSKMYHIPSSMYVEDFIVSDSLFSNQIQFNYPNYSWEEFFNIYNEIQLNKKHVAYKDYSLIKKVGEPHKPYLYLMLGINIGDGLGNDIDPSMNGLLEYMIPHDAYRHYLYEGMALSLCNRLYNDVIRLFQRGAIKRNIPPEYHHYFYTECGRRIGEKYKKDFEKAFDTIETFEEEWRPYLNRGFIWSLKNDAIQDHYSVLMARLDDQYKPLLHQHWGSLFLLDQDNVAEVEDYINRVPEIYKHYYLQGLGRSIALHWLPGDIYGENLKTKLLESTYLFTTVHEDYHTYLYYGLGLSLSLKTFGRLSRDISRVVHTVIPKRYMASFYEGYDFGINLRFGKTIQ